MTQAERWRGALTIGSGWAILEGVAGANALPTHLAHQLTAGVDGPIEIECRGRLQTVPARQYAIIPSGHEHAIGPIGTKLRSIYFDRARAVPVESANRRGFALADPLLSAELDALASTGMLTGRLRELAIEAQAVEPDRSLMRLLESASASATPRSIAAALGVSASRLRHMAHSTFGAPISHVLQWRQLQHAARALSDNASLAQAAAAGGFSDQPHFTRRMRRWFGVAPGAGLSGLQVRIAPHSPDC